MQEQKAGRPVRCLFVISHDFGELGFAYSLLAGSRFTGNARLLLPEHMYKLNEDSLPCPTRCYRSFEDICSETQSYQPELVFLLSGPLFWEKEIASLKDMRRWMEGLRSQGCHIVTSDPFLGIAASFKPSDFSPESLWSRPAQSLPSKLVKSLVVKAKQFRIAMRLRRSHSIFANTAFIFAMPVDHLDSFEKTTCLGFWNTNLLNSGSNQGLGEAPHCLFVLSQLDFQIQANDLGRERFVDILADKLKQVKNLGRRPMLLGPTELLDLLKSRLTEEFHSSLFWSISHRRFHELLVSAEHVFYWNMSSHSMYMRLIMEKPFHFFARGHLSRMIPRWHQRAIQTYYDGTEPDLVEQTLPLDFQMLDQQATHFRERTAGLLERMQEFPSPDRLVSELLGR